MKISVMGYAGSGKTYLSVYLAEKLSLPILHLDEVKFDKDWKPYENEVVLPRVEEFLGNESWIIDGNYTYFCYNERLSSSDIIILLLLPRVSCFISAIKRRKEREAQGYKNDINPWFVWFLLFGGRKRKARLRYDSIVEKYADKVIVLRSRKQINEFINNYEVVTK